MKYPKKKMSSLEKGMVVVAKMVKPLKKVTKKVVMKKKK